MTVEAGRTSTHLRSGIARQQRIIGTTGSALLALPLGAAVPIARFLPPDVYRLWIAAVLGGAVVMVLVLRASRPVMYEWWLVAAFLALTAAVVSTSEAGIIESLFVGAQFALIWTLIPPVARWLHTYRPRAVQAAVAGFLVVQCVSCVAAVMQTLGAEVGGYTATLGRAPGLATHPNLLGIMASLSIAIGLHQFVAAKHRMLATLIVVLNLLGLVLSGSTSAMISCLIGVVIVLWVSRVSLKRVAQLALAVSVATVVAFAALPVGGSFRDPARRFMQVTGQTGETATLFSRLDLVESAWLRIMKDPFVGIGLPDRYAAVGQLGTFVHSFPLRAWMQGGIALFLAAMIVIVLVASQVVISVRQRMNALPASVMAAVIAFSLTSTFFESLYYWLPVVFAWGCLTAPAVPQPYPSLEPGR